MSLKENSGVKCHKILLFSFFSFFLIHKILLFSFNYQIQFHNYLCTKQTRNRWSKLQRVVLIIVVIFSFLSKILRLYLVTVFIFYFQKTFFFLEYKEKTIFLYFQNQKHVWLVEMKKLVWEKREKKILKFVVTRIRTLVLTH